MATNIDNFEQAATLTGSEVLEIGQGNKLVKTTIADIANLAGGSIEIEPFTTLSGTTWDFSQSAKVKQTISANRVYTLTNTTNGGAGLLQITQNGTGGFTITINSIAVIINSAPNSTTLVGFVDVGGSIEISTNIDGSSAPSDNWQQASFNTSNYVESPDGIFKGPSAGTYGNYGLYTSPISASQSVRWIAQYFDADNFNASLCFMKTASANSIPNVDFGVVVPGSDVYFSEYHQGSGSGGNLIPISQLTSGIWYALFRDGSTGTIKIQKSTDKINWINIYTFTEAYTGVIYLYANSSGTATELANPQYLLI